MRFEKQGIDECTLASMAMLADLPLSEVKEKAASITCMPWQVFIRNYPNYFWPLVYKLGQEIGLEDFGDRVFDAGDQYLAAHGGKVIPLQGHIEKPKLDGRGALLLSWEDSNIGHTMAYEDGLIFDPDSNGPMLWDEWVSEQLPRYGRELRTILPVPMVKAATTTTVLN